MFFSQSPSPVPRKKPSLIYLDTFRGVVSKCGANAYAHLLPNHLYRAGTHTLPCFLGGVKKWCHADISVLFPSSQSPESQSHIHFSPLFAPPLLKSPPSSLIRQSPDSHPIATEINSGNYFVTLHPESRPNLLTMGAETESCNPSEENQTLYY